MHESSNLEITSKGNLVIHDIYKQIRDEEELGQLKKNDIESLFDILKQYLIEFDLYKLFEGKDDYVQSKITSYNLAQSQKDKMALGYFIYNKDIYPLRQFKNISPHYQSYDSLFALHLRHFKNKLTIVNLFLNKQIIEFDDLGLDFLLWIKSFSVQYKKSEIVPEGIIETICNWIDHYEINLKKKPVESIIRQKDMKSFKLKNFRTEKGRSTGKNLVLLSEFKKHLEAQKFISESDDSGTKKFLSAFDGSYDEQKPFFNWIADIKELHGLIVLLKDEYKIIIDTGKHHWFIASKIFCDIDSNSFSTEQLRKNNKPNSEKMSILRKIIESTILRMV